MLVPIDRMCVITAATLVVGPMLSSAQVTTAYCEEDNVQQKYRIEVVCVYTVSTTEDSKRKA